MATSRNRIHGHDLTKSIWAQQHTWKNINLTCSKSESSQLKDTKKAPDFEHHSVGSYKQFKEGSRTKQHPRSPSQISEANDIQEQQQLPPHLRFKMRPDADSNICGVDRSSHGYLDPKAHADPESAACSTRQGSKPEPGDQVGYRLVVENSHASPEQPSLDSSIEGHECEIFVAPRQSGRGRASSRQTDHRAIVSEAGQSKASSPYTSAWYGEHGASEEGEPDNLKERPPTRSKPSAAVAHARRVPHLASFVAESSAGLSSIISGGADSNENKTGEALECSFRGCITRCKSLKELKRHKKAKHDYCKLCNIDFADWDEYHAHKMESTAHIVCPVCSADFRTQDGRNAHVRQYHPQGQDLHCPGCGSNFNRAAALMDHMENNRCHAVSKEQFLRARVINAVVHGAFSSNGGGRDVMTQSQKLDLLNDEQFPGLGSAKHAQGARVETHASAAMGSFRDAAQYKTKEKPSNRSKLLPTNSKASQMMHDLNPEKIARLQDLSRKVLSGDKGIRRKDRWDGTAHDMKDLHPLSPFFNADIFRNAHGRFECPFEACNTISNSRPLLLQHCGSNVHQDRSMTCPNCFKRYPSISAFIAHLESPSAKCTIQRSAYYDDALTMASGGFLIRDGFHEDGSVRLKTDEPVW